MNTFWLDAEHKRIKNLIKITKEPNDAISKYQVDNAPAAGISLAKGELLTYTTSEVALPTSTVDSVLTTNGTVVSWTKNVTVTTATATNAASTDTLNISSNLVDGVSLSSGNIGVTKVTEKTPANGISIEGVVFNDTAVSVDEITAFDANGVTIDGCVAINGALQANNVYLANNNSNNIHYQSVSNICMSYKQVHSASTNVEQPVYLAQRTSTDQPTWDARQAKYFPSGTFYDIQPLDDANNATTISNTAFSGIQILNSGVYHISIILSPNNYSGGGYGYFSILFKINGVTVKRSLNRLRCGQFAIGRENVEWMGYIAANDILRLSVKTVLTNFQLNADTFEPADPLAYFGHFDICRKKIA